MPRGRLLLPLLFAGLFTAAVAEPPFLKTFSDVYKPKAGTALQKAMCATCHVPAGPPRRNPYGVDAKNAYKAANFRFTPTVLKQLEKLDSDRDGFSNIAEIRAGTLPGDPKSKPSR